MLHSGGRVSVLSEGGPRAVPLPNGCSKRLLQLLQSATADSKNSPDPCQGKWDTQGPRVSEGLKSWWAWGILWAVEQRRWKEDMHESAASPTRTNSWLLTANYQLPGTVVGGDAGLIVGSEPDTRVFKGWAFNIHSIVSMPFLLFFFCPCYILHTLLICRV